MKLKYSFALIALLALVSACQEEIPAGPKGNQIKFAKVNTSATSPFSEGSTIGLFVGEPVNADNVKFTVEASGEITSEAEIYWALQQTAASDFLAYSPYNATYTGAKTTDFEVAADQSSAEAIVASDLLIATANATPQDGAIDFVFQHKNAKISLYFTVDEKDTISFVEICDVYTKASVSLTNGSISAKGDKGTIKTCLGKDASDKDVYTAIIVPQTTKFTVKATLTDGKVLEFPLAEETSFTSGKQWSNANAPIVIQTEQKPVELSFSVSDWSDGGALVFAGGEQGDDDTHTSIADLAASATSTSAAFSVEVKNVVVTYVYNKFAHLQDETAGIIFYSNSNPFEEGDCINGTISGNMVLYEGYAEITSINLTEATITSVTDIKPMEVTVAQLNANIAQYFNRKVIIKGVNVTTGISSANQTGVIEQKGSSINIFNKSKAAEIEAGATGNIICWPIQNKGTKQVLIYKTEQFIEGSGEDMGEESAFTKTTAFGIYSLPDETTVTPIYAAAELAQTASIKGGSSRKFNVYDFAQGKALYCTLSAANVTKGASVNVTVTSLGLDSSLNGTYATTVLGYSNGTAWLKDTTNNKGFIISIE